MIYSLLGFKVTLKKKSQGKDLLNRVVYIYHSVQNGFPVFQINLGKTFLFGTGRYKKNQADSEGQTNDMI